MLSRIQALQESDHGTDGTAQVGAALARQRAGLFGVMAVMGLVLAIIAPFMGAGLL